MRWEELQKEIDALNKLTSPHEPVQVGDVTLPDWNVKGQFGHWAIWYKADYQSRENDDICVRVSQDGDIDAFVGKTDHNFKNSQELEQFLKSNGFVDFKGITKI